MRRRSRLHRSIRRNRFLIEALEQRVLLSADAVLTAVPAVVVPRWCAVAILRRECRVYRSRNKEADRHRSDGRAAKAVVNPRGCDRREVTHCHWDGKR